MPASGTTVVLIPAQAGVEPASRGLFIIERTGPLPADFCVYTLAGYLAEPPRVWKESPEAVEWLFEATRKDETVNLNDPAVIRALDPGTAVLVRILEAITLPRDAAEAP